MTLVTVVVVVSVVTLVTVVTVGTTKNCDEETIVKREKIVMKKKLEGVAPLIADPSR